MSLKMLKCLLKLFMPWAQASYNCLHFWKASNMAWDLGGLLRVGQGFWEIKGWDEETL